MSENEALGEFPTTGGARPGPVTFPTAAMPAAPFKGSRPMAIRITSIQVDAEVERRPIVDGLMTDPTGPWVVAWYGATSRLGIPGNVVLSGHVDFAGVGPAVFARVGELEPGDRIEVTGDNVFLYQYDVEWSTLYEARTAPVEQIVGATENESLTLITCGGDFNVAAQQYLHRLVIRAARADG